jgi:hypothetical protein
MLGETKKQFSLTREALNTNGRAKSNFLFAQFHVNALFLSSTLPIYATAA